MTIEIRASVPTTKSLRSVYSRQPGPPPGFTILPSSSRANLNRPVQLLSGTENVALQVVLNGVYQGLSLSLTAVDALGNARAAHQLGRHLLQQGNVAQLLDTQNLSGLYRVTATAQLLGAQGATTTNWFVCFIKVEILKAPTFQASNGADFDLSAKYASVGETGILTAKALITAAGGVAPRLADVHVNFIQVCSDATSSSPTARRITSSARRFAP
jgi:hypothetical protein